MTTSISQNTKTPMMAFVELISGFWISQAMYVAAKLGIADLLTEGAKSVDELAKATDTHAPSLYRVLRALGSVGVFTEVEPRRFALTSIGDYLRSDNPYSLRYQAIMHGDEWHWRGVGEMFRSVKEGKPGIRHVYPINSFYEYLAQNSESKSIFDKAMLNVATNYHTPFLESYDFSGFTKVVDVGGNTGAFISAMLKANPHLHGILFDLPDTVSQAANVLEKEGVASRCERVGGDMLKSVPVGGDLYTITYVLPDWDDESCVKILKNVHQAIAKTGKLLVIDSIIPPGDRYHWAKWLDLFELCLGNGWTRTETEYREIFEKAGFRWVNTLSMDTPTSVMELVPM